MALHLAWLPDDILGLIFDLLAIHDLGALSRVSKRFYRLSSDNSLWSRIIQRRHYLRTPEETEDGIRGRMPSYTKKHLAKIWCPPEAVGLTAEILAEMHTALSAAFRDNAETIIYRGQSLVVKRDRDPPRQLSVSWKSWEFSSTMNPSYSHYLPNCIITEGRPSSSSDRAAAAYVNGSVLCRTLPSITITPSPQAHTEPGAMKFLFRHLLVAFYDLCPFCVRNCAFTTSVKVALRACNSCWLLPDLSLFVSADQALAEFGIEEPELEKVVCRSVDPRKQRWVNSKRYRSKVPKEERMYREADLAYLALLKWGSVAAINRRKLNAPDSPVPYPGDWETSANGTKRKRMVARMDEGEEYSPDSGNRKKDIGTQPTRHSSRKAATGKYYGDEPEEKTDTLLSGLLSWGTFGK